MKGVCKLFSSPGNVKYERPVASSKKCRAAILLPKMSKGTAVMLGSNAAYYSRWDEGKSTYTFQLTDVTV